MTLKHWGFSGGRPVVSYLDILGWFCTAGILGGYFALTSGLIAPWPWFYGAGTFTAFGMALSLYPKKHWPAFWLNMTWGVMSLIGVIRG